jgi:multidrug efflux pump subunit AcrB
VLAIGIVVDDAIVVMENVERIMAQEGLPPAQAADKAMGQVAGALVAIVLVLCAVFLPVGFLGGLTGQMYKQFAITLVVAVVISGIVALTLTPALCAVLLRPQHAETDNWFFKRFNRGFERVTQRYTTAVGGAIARPRVWVACFVVMLVLIVVLVRRVPSGFIPTEDKGYFGIVVQLPDGASTQRTEQVVSKIEEYLRKQPAVRYVVSFTGLSFILGTNQTNSAPCSCCSSHGTRGRVRGISSPLCLTAPTDSWPRSTTAVAFGFNSRDPGLGTTAGLEVNFAGPRHQRRPEVRRAW